MLYDISHHLTYDMRCDMICHMKRVTISQLQANITETLADLPVEIIRYGQTVAIIVSPEHSLTGEAGFAELNYDVGDKTPITATELIENPPSEAVIEPAQWISEYTPGYCTKCHKKAEVKLVEYQDADGEEYKETLCKTHVKKLETFLKK